MAILYKKKSNVQKFQTSGVLKKAEGRKTMHISPNSLVDTGGTRTNNFTVYDANGNNTTEKFANSAVPGTVSALTEGQRFTDAATRLAPLTGGTAYTKTPEFVWSNDFPQYVNNKNNNAYNLTDDAVIGHFRSRSNPSSEWERYNITKKQYLNNRNDINYMLDLWSGGKRGKELNGYFSQPITAE